MRRRDGWVPLGRTRESHGRDGSLRRGERDFLGLWDAALISKWAVYAGLVLVLALVLFAVPGFCESRLCGPELEIMRKLHPKYRDGRDGVPGEYQSCR